MFQISSFCIFCKCIFIVLPQLIYVVRIREWIKLWKDSIALVSEETLTEIPSFTSVPTKHTYMCNGYNYIVSSFIGHDARMCFAIVIPTAQLAPGFKRVLLLCFNTQITCKGTTYRWCPGVWNPSVQKSLVYHPQWKRLTPPSKWNNENKRKMTMSSRKEERILSLPSSPFWISWL